MGYAYIKGVKVEKMPKASLIQPHVKEPPAYPRVSDGYEKLAQAIFATQINNMFSDLVKEMVGMKTDKFEW